jgi:hypothetical protein
MNDTREWVHVPPRPERRFYCRVHECIHPASELTPECEHILLDDLKIMLDGVDELNDILTAPSIDDLKRVLWGLAVAYDSEWGVDILGCTNQRITPEARMGALKRAIGPFFAETDEQAEAFAKWLTEGQEGWS